MRSAVRIRHLAFAVAGDQSDDVLAGPVFEVERRCLGGGDTEPDLAGADLGHQGPGDADGLVGAASPKAPAHGRPDIAPLVAEAWSQRKGPAQQCCDPRRALLAVRFQLHVIDPAQRLAFEVDEETVQQGPGDVERVVHYRPAFVASINGMAANEATVMMTR